MRRVHLWFGVTPHYAKFGVVLTRRPFIVAYVEYVRCCNMQTDRHDVCLSTYFFGAFEKLPRATIIFEVSVRPHGTTLSLN